MTDYDARIEELETRVAALEEALAKLQPAPSKPAPAPARPKAEAEEEIPWAVLAATIAAMLPDKQIKSLSVVSVEARPVAASWVLAGKLDIFQSHRIR